MAQYLEKFKGTIGKRQSEQIVKLLNKKRNTGQIRTVQEFTEQLGTLMRELTSTVLQPSLNLFFAEENEIADSETYNFMLDRVEDDLVAAFEESVKIDEIQQSHEAIIRDVILKNLKAGVAELESKITLYEFLNKDLRGFDSAIFSTFRESKEGRTQRGVAQASVLFIDPRTKTLVPSSEDATIELTGERLTLPVDNLQVFPVQSIRQIFDATAPQSEFVVEPSGSSIKNVIDNTKGTYWIQSLLFEKQKESVKTKIELDLGTVKEVNFIEVEPASRYGLILEAVHYVDGNNVVVDLEVPEITITTPVSIQIRKTAARLLILTFRNENASRIQFEYSDKAEPLFSQALREPPQGLRPQTGGVSEDLNKLISSAKVKELVGVSVEEKSSFAGYEFLTGFDNINVGLAGYLSRGIYLSIPLELDNMGTMGLKTLEARPYLDNSDGIIKITNTTYDIDGDSLLTDDSALAAGGTSNNYFLTSIEYWVVRQEQAEDGTLLRTTVFPIMPMGKGRIHHERLLLTEKSVSTLLRDDLGETVFFTNQTASEGNIKVYRNGVLLVDESTNTIATDGWKIYPPTTGDAVDRRPNNNDPMRFRIQIVNPLAGDFFTVSYNPLTSSTRAIPTEISDFSSVGGLKIVDLVGDLSARLEDGKVIILDKPGENIGTVATNAFLAIIMRQNAAGSALTPSVEEYTLVAGFKDQTKFEED